MVNTNPLFQVRSFEENVIPKVEVHQSFPEGNMDKMVRYHQSHFASQSAAAQEILKTLESETRAEGGADVPVGRDEIPCQG